MLTLLLCFDSPVIVSGYLINYLIYVLTYMLTVNNIVNTNIFRIIPAICISKMIM